MPKRSESIITYAQEEVKNGVETHENTKPKKTRKNFKKGVDKGRVLWYNIKAVAGNPLKAREKPTAKLIENWTTSII